VRSDQDSARARENGAEEIINTRSGNLPDAVRSMTDGRGADVIFDTSGQMFAESIEAAAIEGRISIISAPADGKSTFNLRTVYRKELRLRGVDTRRLDVVACARHLAEIRSGFESGKFKVSPGQSRPLAAASEAYEQAGLGKGRFYFRPMAPVTDR
jgi:NADPH2:quinone reductase